MSGDATSRFFYIHARINISRILILVWILFLYFDDFILGIVFLGAEDGWLFEMSAELQRDDIALTEDTENRENPNELLVKNVPELKHSKVKVGAKVCVSPIIKLCPLQLSISTSHSLFNSFLQITMYKIIVNFCSILIVTWNTTRRGK